MFVRLNSAHALNISGAKAEGGVCVQVPGAPVILFHTGTHEFCKPSSLLESLLTFVYVMGSVLGGFLGAAALDALDIFGFYKVVPSLYPFFLHTSLTLYLLVGCCLCQFHIHMSLLVWSAFLTL